MAMDISRDLLGLLGPWAVNAFPATKVFCSFASLGPGPHPGYTWPDAKQPVRGPGTSLIQWRADGRSEERGSASQKSFQETIAFRV